MGGSEKSGSIVNAFSTLLLEAWEKWDVRGMVLFSLTLQIILSIVGGRRKYKINPFLKIILWFAYLGADWIAIATLGKLSSTYTESPTNVLRAYWGPLLLLHLGGPDTITAYSFEDNKLWIRHLLILFVKVILIIYLICLSWTFSWLSFLTLPLILSGIIKYVEKILCLKLNNSRKAEPIFSNLFKPQSHQHIESSTLEQILKENPTLLQSYLLFTVMRPDVNDYLSSQNSSDFQTKIITYLKECTRGSPINNMGKYFSVSLGEVFKVHAIQLGFMFDVVYTKTALIYTKLGCILRLTSFASSFSVLLLFFISIINEPKFHFSRIDIAITGILLCGAIALELYAAWIMLSSNWAVLVAGLHHNVLVRALFKAALKYFPHLLRQSKKWADQMGQFDLLEYCFRYRKSKASQFWASLRKITNWNEIIKLWHKYRFTKFVNVPDFLKQVNIYGDLMNSINLHTPSLTSRGQGALLKWQLDQLSWSVDLDFDHSIIVWHLATSVCFLQEDNDDDDAAMKISKQVSDYMMYLLAMCPTLICPDGSFWLDHTYDKLKELLISATDIKNAASTLVPDPIPNEELEFSEPTGENQQASVSPATDVRTGASTLLSHQDNVHEEEHKSSKPTGENLQAGVPPAIDIRTGAPTSFSDEDNVHEEEHKFSSETNLKEILQEDVFILATILKQSQKKWEIIRDVWIELFFYAAVSTQHFGHVKQLGEGIEFLSLIRFFLEPDVAIQCLPPQK